MKKFMTIALVLALSVSLIGCASMSNKQKGAAAGGAAGAAVGAGIGNAAGNTAIGAILGAVIGGAAGAYIGGRMDQQAAEMEQDLEGATIERIGEGIKVTFDSGILFDVDSSSLQTAAKDNLTKLAEILAKYEDTEIIIEGHTDATGSEEYNMELSRKRADSVATLLGGLQIDARRFTVMGYGEEQPVASNDSVDGRQANRRVDLAIFANDKLKKYAEEQAG